VLAEYFLQVPWACWLLGGGGWGVTFAACLFLCGLYTDQELRTKVIVPPPHLSAKWKKRPAAAADHRYYAQKKCILAFAMAVHVWLLQSVAASANVAVWTRPQWLKLSVSCYFLWFLWRPKASHKSAEWRIVPQAKLAIERVETLAKPSA